MKGKVLEKKNSRIFWEFMANDYLMMNIVVLAETEKQLDIFGNIEIHSHSRLLFLLSSFLGSLSFQIISHFSPQSSCLQHTNTYLLSSICLCLHSYIT
jgi:hypothetical protein